MTVLGDKLSAALMDKENKQKNDINSFIWKGAKKVIRDSSSQSSMKLVDATEEQLNTFYKHCLSMLYNKDSNNPGRYTLLEIIKEQRRKCNAELFLRYLEGGTPENGRTRIPRFTYLEALLDFLDLNKQVLPKETWSTTSITVATSGIPEEFNGLSINLVLDACSDTLGVFNRKHITMNFITKMGLWLTPQEIQELTEKDPETGKTRDRLLVIIERLNLKNIGIAPNPNRPTLPYLRISPKGLSFSEFRAITNLKNKKYTDMTTMQLQLLRDKILFRLETEVRYHISQWEERMRQIKLVADSKGFKINEEYK